MGEKGRKKREAHSQPPPLPSCGLAEDILRPDLSSETKASEGPGTGRNRAQKKGEKEAMEQPPPLPSCGLAEDILKPDFFAEMKTAEKQEQRKSGNNSTIRREGLTKFVTFFLDAEEYALPVSQVREIKRVGEITRVPNAPQHIRGVMNLRGRIVPVLELKKRLQLGEAAIDMDSRIVVVEQGNRVLGLMVDRVSQVMNIAAEQIDNAPEEVVQVNENYLKGVGKLDERMIILLDLEQITGKEVES
ncbi:MAG: chemotaxis protein CheW [bacterium]